MHRWLFALIVLAAGALPAQGVPLKREYDDVVDSTYFRGNRESLTMPSSMTFNGVGQFQARSKGQSDSVALVQLEVHRIVLVTSRLDEMSKRPTDDGPLEVAFVVDDSLRFRVTSTGYRADRQPFSGFPRQIWTVDFTPEQVAKLGTAQQSIRYRVFDRAQTVGDREREQLREFCRMAALCK